MEVVSKSAHQTQKIGEELAKTLKGGDVVALFGDLGAGKTVFVKGIAIGLGIKKQILSPTFVFVRSYPSTVNRKPSTFHHVDLYRAENIRDLQNLGLPEIFSPDSIVVIEWADRLGKNLPKKRWEVKIEKLAENKRMIRITPSPSISLPLSSPSTLSSPLSPLSFPRNLSSTPIEERESIKKAADILKSGGVVIFPTDTVYGIGCRFDDQKAIDKIYKIKGTPKNQPFPILVSSIKQAEALAEIPDVAQELMQKYWPGALTIILLPRRPKTSAIATRRLPNVIATPDLIRGKQSIQKLGLRMPNSDLMQSLIEKVGVPIIGTSANIHGKGAVRTSSQLDPRLTKQVNYVLEGECKGGIESTVIDATVDPPKVLRQGAVRLPVIPAKLVLDPDRGAGIQTLDSRSSRE